MQQFTLILKDDSKREFLLELLARLEFVEFKDSKKQPDLKPDNGKQVQSETPAITLKRGSAKGLIGYVPDDFTASLEDFKEYM